ncbi:MAG: 16S rRNA (guanine(527)-N(7))-methyltransferase RsmG [Oscillospiraceae bacterium]|jgi:16S rRNA (guanine527-N7)-methyltransferase|nr:16S rRNA (guanine(527)-N(7))-methyltransferase RsmG [Oscillospiraceae bacterium]
MCAIFPAELLRSGAATLGTALDDRACARFSQYFEILHAQAQIKNLTAITTPEEVVEKHFLDSLLLLPWLKPARGAQVLDVGTGAGFPGVPLAIARTDLNVTLLEATGKKADFLRLLLSALSLENVTVVHARAEEAAHGTLREGFAFVTARAVAPLPLLCELCLPFVRVGGAFAAMKGSEAAVQAELNTVAGAVRTLGGCCEGVLQPAQAPAYGARCCVLFRKISQTPPKYPRKFGIILKNPL